MVIDNGSALRRYSKFVCFCVVLLIFKGALVTSNDAGLSVPDWPTSYGDNMFLFPPNKWTGIIFYEHVHRLLASFVGLLTVVLTGWILWVEKRRWVKLLSLFALVTVILQGVLGGLTVIYQLPTAISSAHAVLAQTFFILTILIAYSQSKESQRLIEDGKRNISASIFKSALFFCALVYLQLIFGAVMRHSEAGLAVPDFPTMGGKLMPIPNQEMVENVNAIRQGLALPLVNIFQVCIHLMHRIGAFLVVLSFVPLYLILFKSRFTLSESSKVFFTASIIAVLLAIQFLLGIMTIYSLRNPWIASTHVALGAALLGLSVILSIRIFRVRYN